MVAPAEKGELSRCSERVSSIPRVAGDVICSAMSRLEVRASVMGADCSPASTTGVEGVGA